MITEIEFPQSAFDNTWDYYKENKTTYSMSRYSGWLAKEHNILLGEKYIAPHRYCYTITGEEKELTMFLLRWS